MLIESGIGCCCPKEKEDVLFWKNRHIDAMQQLVKIRQENLELRKQLAGAKAQCKNTVENRRKINELSQEVINLREQLDIDMCVKKDLDDKLDKAAADYKALLVENEEKIHNAAKSYAKLAIERNNLAETITRMEKTIRDLDERNGTLRERLVDTNASLKRSVQRESDFQSRIDYLEHRRQCQAKEIERLREIVDAPNGSCSAYTQRGMQSKIVKQANEIKRLTEENKQLHRALDIAAKDADTNFERGKIKGMKEIWKELVDCYDGRPIGENNKIFGYHTVGDILMNLSPTWFINKAEEYHKQEEKKEQQAKDIQIGDEVEIFDEFCPDNDPHSDIGIVIAIDKDNPCFAVIGPKFEGCFDETDIQSGNVKKTGRHFDSIPLDYFA